MGLGYR
jgi:hypothetical protein